MATRPVVVVGAAERWSQGLSNEVLSFPLSRTASDSSPVFAIDPARPWTIVLARGSCADGFDTVDLNQDGAVLLRRKKWGPIKNDVVGFAWEEASLTLPHEAILTILDALSETQLLGLKNAYYAAVHDGTQWVIQIEQETNEKSVYCDNHFPNAIVRFAGSLDAVLDRNGVGTVKWRQLPDEPGITQLIQALASSNKEPYRDYRDIDIPPDYDRRAQVKVLDAWIALLRKGIDAFPQLVANADDLRYCCSAHGANGDVNISVGGACHHIIVNQVAIFHDVVDHPAPGAAPRHFADEGLAAWWAKNQHRTLLELQIEATKQALKELKNPSEIERQLRESPIVNDRQQKNITRLETLLERLKASKHAIQPRTVEGYDCQSMIGLPEDTRNHHPFKNANEPTNKP